MAMALIKSEKKANEINVWDEFQELINEYHPVNLALGFPDFTPFENVIDNLIQVIEIVNPLMHQYARGFGHQRLANILSKMYAKLIGREIDASKNILVTIGGQEALFCTLTGHINQNDEVIVIDPSFDTYRIVINMCGGMVRSIPLKSMKQHADSSQDWLIDPNDLKMLFNERTKAIIINTPHNPTGKVFNLEELQLIADLCIQWDVLCIADEVYEWLVSEPQKHIRIASLPGMWDRTITIGSAGKTFCVTGWRIGWAYGPDGLLENIRTVHHNCVYSCPTPIQEALASSFEMEFPNLGTDQSNFIILSRELRKKRDFLVDSLRKAGFVPTVPDGGYFIVADWSKLESQIDLSGEDDDRKDYRFAKWFIKNIGIACLPASAFYADENKHLGARYVRICFVKSDKLLEEAAEALKKFNIKK